MARIRVTRTIEVPDPIRISRFRKIPELGPRLLFFSGGSALNGLSRLLKDYTHNSVHLVTPFDSGGSSAQLRQAFDMPAIGDIRSRLMALADESVLGNPEVYQLFNFRLPCDATRKTLRRTLREMVSGRSELVADIPNPMRQLICHQLGHFSDQMPRGFELRGASIGNLILAGGYLRNRRDLDLTIFLYSKLVSVRGTVRPIVNESLNLGATLADGSEVIGQHLLTGKEVAPLTAPIEDVFLCRSAEQPEPLDVPLEKKVRKLIGSADLICYPPGSFFSSLHANLLPTGVGRAIGANDCPKVYIPNLGVDPEQLGMSLDALLGSLVKRLRRGVPKSWANRRLLDYVLLDSGQGQYPSTLSLSLLEELGVEVLDIKLVSKKSKPYYDNQLLLAALLSLA
ncbi:GAK system CofD-like protein [Parahaliea maris]|uniref:GAK system CofD-like protein n=1 Tax=Parahaliea maris TaxID=2716870 RepID=A0A5C9A4E2_9GAMM|nr:GAK system CofD-like protein [Parahaliea maris]TXS95773.1 GAK system CofD-like protein [Parahaliea maris]